MIDVKKKYLLEHFGFDRYDIDPIKGTIVFGKDFNVIAYKLEDCKKHFKNSETQNKWFKEVGEKLND